MNEITYDALTQSPIGPVWVAISPAGLVSVYIGDDEAEFIQQVHHLTGRTPRRDKKSVAAALGEIEAYLAGEQRHFSTPVNWTIVTGFQRKVLGLVQNIPYGHWRTYGEIAGELGNKGAARAVGRANATNPLPLVIPCHRVLGSDGKLHGYGGGNGVETKAWLLQLEGSRLL